MKARGSVEIGRPAAEVFAYLGDVSNNHKWEPEVLEMEITSEGPLGVGTKGRRVEKFMGREESTWEVTEYEANRSFAVTFDSAKFSGDIRWGLEPAGEGTRLSYRIQVSANNIILNLLMPLMSPIARRQMRRNHLRLKRLLESGG